MTTQTENFEPQIKVRRHSFDPTVVVVECEVGELRHTVEVRPCFGQWEASGAGVQSLTLEEAVEEAKAQAMLWANNARQVSIRSSALREQVDAYLAGLD